MEIDGCFEEKSIDRYICFVIVMEIDGFIYVTGMKLDLSQIGVDLEMIQNMVFGLVGHLGEAYEELWDLVICSRDGLGSAIVSLPIADGESNFTNLSSKTHCQAISKGALVRSCCLSPSEDPIPDPRFPIKLMNAMKIVHFSYFDAMKERVIQTRSVEFMPFSLSLFSFLASSLWTAYGLLSNDLLLTFPNILGCPLGLLQLLSYFKYSGKRGQFEEPLIKVDIGEACAPFLIHTKEEQESVRFDVVVEDIEAPSLMLNVQHTSSFIDDHISEIRVDLSSPLLVSVCA
ncbi:hypothetical protein Scep_027479 [Stephania cephalantha]|uniref:Bidirectional sugar transporter SWEET n=1 Tax=Stephania cephalantha TaxID=152367 RepID=A0AAP0ECM0_9MAGN